MERVRVFLAEDHEAMRDFVARLLPTEFEIVGTATDGRQTLEAVKKLRSDILILDITMPVMSGIEAAIELNEVAVSPKIVFLTVHDDPDFAKAALKVGALGYVTKPCLASDLIIAVKEAHAGRTFLSAPVQAPTD